MTQNNRKFLNAHIVTSVYGRRSIEKYISNAENEGRLLLSKKEETSQGIPQVQYEGNINEISSDNSILDSTSKSQEKLSDREIAGISNNDYAKMYNHFGSTKNYDVAGYTR